MKKLFSTMLAATMVAGMSVSAFAYTNENGATDAVIAKDLNINADGYDFALDLEKALDSKGNEVTKLDGGSKLYYPIVVSEEQLELDDETATEYFYATKSSEIDGLSVKIDGEIGEKYIKDATIVKKAIEGTEAGQVTVAGGEKVYMVQVEMNDYFGDEAKEVEFNLSLKANGRVAFDTEDDADGFDGEFDLGADAEALTNDATTGYKKFRNNELTLEIDADTGVVTLDEAHVGDASSAKEDIEFIYLEGKDANFTFDVKASGQDALYLELNQDAVKEIAVANGKADLTFFNFPGEPEFDFSGTAKFGVEDEDEDNYIYEIVDGELVEASAKYNEEDGVFELRTNKLGSYVLSDMELEVATEEETTDEEDKESEETGGKEDATTPSEDGEKENANTGAADMIGVASALAVVSVAAAGAVALKK